jgi:large subunit ribosomal protein L31e
MSEESNQKEQKTEEQRDLAETVEEAEVEEKVEEVSEKEEEGKAEESVEAEAAEETPAPVEEETKPPPREERVKEEGEIVEERIYTIPLGKVWIMPPNKRAPRAMRMIRSFVIRHMKLEVRGEEEGEEEEEPKRLVVSNEVNEKVWSRGIEKPPRNVRVRAAKDKDGNVTVYLAEGD